MCVYSGSAVGVGACTMLRSKVTLPVSRHELVFRKVKLPGQRRLAQFITLKDKPQVNFKGAHRIIQELVAPKYNKKAATRDGTPPELKSRKYKKSAYKYGCNRGNRLDAQLTKTLEIFNKHLPPHSIFYDKASFGRYVGLGAAYKKWMWNKLYLPEMAYAWAWFEKMKLRPVATQVMVCNTAIGVATPIDMVCVDEKGRWVMMEWKNGSKHDFFHHTGNKMLPPFDSVSDSKYHQAHVQLLIGELLFRSTFGVAADKIAPVHWVVRVDHEYIDGWPLAEWAIKGKRAFIDKLCGTNSVKT